MPRSAHNDIIDLTDVIEEGHPERPNLAPSKSSASDSDGMLDDLDLEREIDQIFADLGPGPSKDDQPSGSPRSMDPDSLDLDDLFADQEAPGKAPAGQVAPADKNTVADEFSEIQDDFEDLFAEKPPQAQELQADPDLEAQPTDRNEPAQEPMSAVHDADKLSLEITEEPHDTESLPPESSTDLVAEAMSDEIADEQLAARPGEPASDQQEDSLPKFTDDASIAANFPEGGDSGAHQAVDPSMLETILRRLDELELKQAALEQIEPVQPDMDALLEQVSGQADSRFDSLLQEVRQTGSQTLEELEQLRQADQAVESRLSHESQRLEELAEQLKADQEQRLEQLTGVLREEMTQRIEEAAGELKEYLVGHVETQFSQLNQRLEELQDRNQGSEEEPGSPDSGLEEQESRILETVRSEIQDLRTEWEGQRSTLAGDLENSLNYWTRLQEKFNAMQEEWSILREAQELQASDQQPDDMDPEAIESRIEQLRTELRAELLDEIHKAVPGAAAQIIREEIQALSQEES
ncbi:hypothetical protein [Desulfonatronum parangueonense]